MRIGELYEQSVIAFGGDISRQMFLNILHEELKYISRAFEKVSLTSVVGDGEFSLGGGFSPPISQVVVDGKPYKKIPWKKMVEGLGVDYQIEEGDGE